MENFSGNHKRFSELIDNDKNHIEVIKFIYKLNQNPNNEKTNIAQHINELNSSILCIF